MCNTIVGAGAVGAGAGAASHYGSGSDQKMRLLVAPAPQHWFHRHYRGTKAHFIHGVKKSSWHFLSLGILVANEHTVSYVK
jgi:hypothetical protein